MPVIGAIMRGFRLIPVYRAQDGADTAQNEATFQAVFEALREGDLVCLFPEGRSHDEPTLQKLKTGAARMALGAEASRDFGLGVKIVPVGLVYRAKRRFRSRVAACVGAPIGVQDLAELHARDERAAVHELNERIAAGLRGVTLELDRWEDLPLLELAALLVRANASERLTTIHEFADGVQRLRERDPARVDELTDRVAALRDRLRRLGLGPENIHVRYSVRGVVVFCLRNLAILFLLLPLALAGSIFWILPYLLVPELPRWGRVSRSVHATVQVLAGLVLLPGWLLGWSLALGWLQGWTVGLALFLTAPLLGLVALLFHDWRREVVDDIVAFLRLSSRQRLRECLARDRDELASRIETLRTELAEAG
jgi:hypothetical protein